jgi:PGF-CTERM protein
MSNITLNAALFQSFMEVRLSNDTAPGGPGGQPDNLEGLGVKDDTEFEMTLTVSDYKPNSLLWGVRGVNWDIQQNNSCQASNCHDITISGKSIHMEAINDPYDGQADPIGPKRDIPTTSWPNSNNDVADMGMNDSVFMYLLDIPETGGFASGFSGMTVTTNAQTFTRPKMVNDTLQVYVGAPHTTRAGNTHDGFYRAFLPEEQLSEWGIDKQNASTKLAAKYQGNTASFSVNETANGAWVNIDLHYSDGVVQVGDSQAVDTTSNDPPNFDVTVDSTNGPVAEGETVEVTATVQNTGGKQDTQTATLKVDGSPVDTSDSLTLTPGQQETVTFEWQTSNNDAGLHTVNVTSENTSATETVSVTSPATFAVQTVSSNSPVSAGDTLTVSASVQNTGGSQATQTVTLDVGGSQRDSKQVTLASGGTKSVSFTWATTSDDGGDYTATVSTDDTSKGTSVTVESSDGGGSSGPVGGTPLPSPGGAGDSGSTASTSLSIDSVSSPVSVGDTVEVVATVSNPTNSSVGRTLNLQVGGSTVDSSFVTAAAGGSATATLRFTVTEGMAADSIGVTVASSTDEASATVDVTGVEGDTDDQSGDEDDEESSEQSDTAAKDSGGNSIPGFGPVAALLALLGWAGLQRRRQ